MGNLSSALAAFWLTVNSIKRYIVKSSRSVFVFKKPVCVIYRKIRIISIMLLGSFIEMTFADNFILKAERELNVHEMS